jgi:uncharacterized protein (DUF2147 family)
MINLRKAIRLVLMLAFLMPGLSMLSSSAYAQEGSRIVGVWVTAKNDGRVKIQECGDGHYCGKLTWTENKSSDKSLEKDVHNPDPEKRDRPILGIRVLKDLEYNTEDDIWENGKIYDPKKGKTYNCYVEMLNEDKLKVRGYVGVSMFGRTTYWKRYEGSQ